MVLVWLCDLGFGHWYKTDRRIDHLLGEYDALKCKPDMTNPVLEAKINGEWKLKKFIYFKLYSC